jgi:hypothetical protein
MSIRTIALTLKPTDAEATALARLQEAFNAAMQSYQWRGVGCSRV